MLKLLSLGIIVSGIFTGCGQNNTQLSEVSGAQNFIPAPYSDTINQTTQMSPLVQYGKNDLPEVVISSDKNFCENGNEITFSGLASHAAESDNQIVSYEWISDGNIIGTDANITIACDSEEKKDICLQITDDDGQTIKKCYTYNDRDHKTLPPKAVISVALHPEHGFWFKCSGSHDQDSIDSDYNSSNDQHITNATWKIYQTIRGKKTLVAYDTQCNQWIDVSDELDLMEVTLTVTDDDNETASVTKAYTWNGHHLIEQ